MEYRIYREAEFQTSRWTGGTTRQLAIFPEHASYLDRNFLWRLSTAECTQETSEFSRLPDYDRVLLVLSGSVVLAHQDVRVARLQALEQDRFDGAYHTKCFGTMTDYNLMVAKGCRGTLEVCTLTEENQALALEPAEDFAQRAVTCFCPDGFATVDVQGKLVMVQAGEQLVVLADAGEDLAVSVMGEGKLICGQILYNDRPGEYGPTYIPPERVCFDDFLCCMYLANVQFRGARFLIPRLKRQWFDEALSGAIRKIERIYLTFLVFMLGFFVIVWRGVQEGGSLHWIWPALIWLVVDCLLVSPLLYLVVMPKPVRKHIKDVDQLTPYEAKVRERELNTNERAERILRRYKNTGRIQYDKDGNPIRRDDD